MKAKFYLFYERESGSLYAWTENKEIAELFRLTRSKKFFMEKRKKYDPNELRAALFRRDYSHRLLFMNVLGRNKKDSIEFPTTPWENARLEEACDAEHDRMISLSRFLCMLPLEDEVRDAVETLAFIAAKDGEKNYQIDSYRVFCNLFKETIL